LNSNGIPSEIGGAFSKKNYGFAIKLGESEREEVICVREERANMRRGKTKRWRIR